MKRILSIFALVVMVITAVSCDSEQTPSLSFDKPLYLLASDDSWTVDIVASVAPVVDLKVDLIFSGDAVIDEDYTVSVTSVVIPAGQAKGSVTITPSNNFDEGKNIIVSMKMPTGYQSGKYPAANLYYSKEELIYSFYTSRSDVVGSYCIKVDIEGVDSGSDWRATSDMNIPFNITPIGG